MAVTSHTYKNDPAGKVLDALITAQQTVVNGLSPTGTAAALYRIASAKLYELQVQAVEYYLSIGRINAATILSSLS